MSWEKALRVAVWVTVAVAAALGTVNQAAMVVRDLPGDYVEGVVLAAQEDVRAGHGLYDPKRWSEPPYSVNLYGPVYYHLGAWAAGLVGAGPSLAPGRTLSLLSLVLALAALWRIQRRLLGLSRSDALLGVLLPLGYLPLVVFAGQYRVDVFAIACELWGLVLAVQGGWCLVAAPVLLVLAVYTKSTAVAAVLALGVWWLTLRRVREVAVVSAGCLILGGAWLVALSLLSDGAFTRSVFGFNALPYSIGGLLQAAQQAFGGGLLPVAAGVAVALLVGAEVDAEARLLALYLLTALAMALATVGRVGANFNYFIEPGLLLGPVLALAWSRAADATRSMSRLAVPAVGLALVASNLLWTAPRVAWEWRGRATRATTEQRLAELVRPGDTILTMEVASALRLGARPYVNDPCIFSRLAEKGLWDESRMLSDLAGGAVTWVLADEDMAAPKSVYSNWTDDVRTAVAAGFERVEVIGPRLRLYRTRRASGDGGAVPTSPAP